MRKGGRSEKENLRKSSCGHSKVCYQQQIGYLRVLLEREKGERGRKGKGRREGK